MYQYIKNDESKVVVRKKYDQKSFCWKRLLERTRRGSVSEIIEHYQGFEGELKFLSSLEDFESMHSQLHIHRDEALLFITPPAYPLPLSVQDQATKMGYDYGICEGQQAVYSSIFNEILFGAQMELLQYRECVNDNLLFPSLDVVDRYVKEHQELLLKGRDVEGDEEMKIYEVWSNKNQ